MATDVLPTFGMIDDAYGRGFSKGYEMGARGHVPSNMLVMVLPPVHSDVLERVRERVHQMLVEEGLSGATVLTLEDE